MSKNQFNEKMIEVAKILGMTWEGGLSKWNTSGNFRGENQVNIWARNAKGKINFSSCYPTKVMYRDRVEIGVSEDKTPEQIAKDIQRRFLPTYLVNLKEAKAQIEVHNNYEAAKQANIEKIATYFGEQLWEGRTCIYPKVKEIDKIEALNDCLIKFTVEGSPELAIQIIELLQEKGRT